MRLTSNVVLQLHSDLFQFAPGGVVFGSPRATTSWNVVLMVGRTGEYVSVVRTTLAWPRCSLTIFGFTPALNKSVAQVWRRSLRRISGRSDLFNSGLKYLVGDVPTV
jgi:hypothetical protein